MATTISPTYAAIGSISSGTMRPEDLIPAFIEALDNLKEELSLSLKVGASFEETEDVKQRVSQLDDLLADIEQNQHKIPNYFDSEDAMYDLNETLFDALQEFAPPYCYFGSHPGDGADFGFWPSQDAIDDATYDGESLAVSDLSEVPNDYVGDVIHVTDHGNTTLYVAENGELTELWAFV